MPGRLLEANGISMTVADVRFAKPLDTGLIDQLCAHQAGLVTLEQGAQGGFCAQVLHYLANSGGFDRGIAVRTMTLPDRFIGQGQPCRDEWPSGHVGRRYWAVCDGGGKTGRGGKTGWGCESAVSGEDPFGVGGRICASIDQSMRWHAGLVVMARCPGWRSVAHIRWYSQG